MFGFFNQTQALELPPRIGKYEAIMIAGGRTKPYKIGSCKSLLNLMLVPGDELADFPLDAMNCLDTSDIAVSGDSFFPSNYLALKLAFIPCLEDPTLLKSSCAPSKEVNSFVQTASFRLWTPKTHLGPEKQLTQTLKN